MSSIKLMNIGNYACRGVNLEVASGELLVLLGPNGAGKSTLLNIIAGLTEYEGSVAINDCPVDNVPPQGRGVGYLFQDLVLFPHLDVASNVGYGLKAHGWPKQRIEKRVHEMLDLVRIKHLAHSYPSKLSGGEKQRLALARALAPSPNILLLDEPLSSMDLQTAKYLRLELKRIQQSIGITTIYVTHNLYEAEEVADRIAVLFDGRIEQAGMPHEIFFYPRNEKVAQYIGTPNIMECEHEHELGHGLMEVLCCGIPIVMAKEGEKLRRIAFSPRDVYVSLFKPPGPEVNRFKGIISDIKILSEVVRLRVNVETTNILAELPSQAFAAMRLMKGQEVYLIIKLKSIRADYDTRDRNS
ncbi:MAG: hypothetical protein DRN37_01380 [Thermoplasmata archaeon]|nr:MAG: hypothetical protein DRN37_01380 [Thermoplasmata archaeon]